MTMFDTILEQGRNGSEQALMKLYDICCDAVFNASYNIVLNKDDAEEITQDAILKVFTNLSNFNGTQRDFIAFAKTIAINKSIDEYRRSSREPFRVEIEEFKESFDEDSDFDENYSIEKIKKAIENLPEGYRIVISMRIFEEMEYEDIANILKINESSVRSQYARGIAKLRTELREQRSGSISVEKLKNYEH